ncbi:MAG: hypothetical protein M1820_009445 [Bogoriella megaspora]|nr:MAG: hypothetical protein M1820_009445 [Bogoriella megaspora]
MAGTTDSNGGVDPRQEDKYLLLVTAGPTYTTASKHLIHVNSPSPCHITSSLMTVSLSVRIRDYHGLPPNSPPSSPYFSHPLHAKDRYSISYTFNPHQDIPGEDLVMGFDFDHPVRDRLPPGFQAAMKVATKVLDPGIYAEPYADEPFLYGAALSSWFAFRVGGKEKEREGVDTGGEEVVEEGAEGEEGARVRRGSGMPEKAEKRRKWFLKEEQLKGFVFEKGRWYGADFFNPYLDFGNFALKLPGISISVAKYIDEKTHALRYVLKNRRTGELYFVVIFKLLFGKEMEEELQRQNQDRIEQDASKSVGSDNVQSSSSNESPISEAAHDSNGRPSSSNDEGGEGNDSQFEIRSKQEEKNSSVSEASPTAVDTTIDSIRIALSALGFGSSTSSNSDDEDSHPEAKQDAHGSSTQQVKEMGDKDVEEFLRQRHSSIS